MPQSHFLSKKKSPKSAQWQRLDNGKCHAFAARKFLALQFAFCWEWRKRGDAIRDPIGLNGGVNHANWPIETEVPAPQNLKSQRRSAKTRPIIPVRG